MTQLPMLTARKLIKVLKRSGFVNIRQEGSHLFFKHPDGRTTVVPFHSGHDIGRGLLRSILIDITLMPKDLQKLL
ncbi:MAG: type II toxin-antitoxin system HicA family toxin [Patescibacteria group bacterium]